MDRTQWLSCKDKYGSHSYYHLSVNIMHIDYTQTENSGTLVAWSLSGDHACSGTTADEFITYCKQLIEKYDMTYECDEKKITNTLIIYIDNLKKVTGFFKPYITNKDNSKSIVLIDHIEFRSYLDLNSSLDDEHALDAITDYMNMYFIPEKRWYITMQQRTRYLLKFGLNHKPNARRKKGEEKVRRVTCMPESADDLVNIHLGCFGGLTYCPIPGKYYDYGMLYGDIDSAYIWALLTQKFPSSNPVVVKYPNIDNSKGHFGYYRITYDCKKHIIDRFKQVTCTQDKLGFVVKKADAIPYGKHTINIWLNDVDLESFQHIAKVEKIEPIKIYEFDMDYIPQYIRELLLHLYDEKSNLKPKNKIYKKQYGIDMPEYVAIKAQLNGVYGNLFRRKWAAYTIEDKMRSSLYKKNSAGIPVPKRRDSKSNSLYDEVYVCPYYAGFVTAYVFRQVLRVGLSVEHGTWAYSATDSNICKDTEHNRQIFDKINKQIADTNKALGVPEQLGQYEVTPLRRLKTFKKGQYVYEDNDGEMYIKACGCSVEAGPNYFDADRIPKGTIVYEYDDDGYYTETKSYDDDVVAVTAMVGEYLSSKTR